ncbi:hypothetical protein E2C01_077073 [Portunus trituberculatus]|uniref:Uncharacterized protein n=1 Tax=Portunus trituberculatus TaxID=210409 RepID=A0A5B7IKS6_PORTR|nr:hypothetical protein [Portunus trituberculatus]
MRRNTRASTVRKTTLNSRPTTQHNTTQLRYPTPETNTCPDTLSQLQHERNQGVQKEEKGKRNP